MFHGLDNRFLYSAYQLVCTFISGKGDKVRCAGTGFWVQSDESKLALVTNRHVLDLGFADPQYAGYSLQQLRVLGKGTDVASGLPSIDIDLQVIIDRTRISYSSVPENDIACLIEPAVASTKGSSDIIPYHLDKAV